MDRALNKEHFYGKIIQKMFTKRQSQVTKQVQKNSFISDVLPDNVVESGFLVIPNTTSANLCKPIHGILLNLKSVEMKVKNYKNLNISRTKRAFQME